MIFISLLILVTTLGCLHASIITGARPYYAMSRERLFFSGIGKLNRHNVPGNSLLWQGIWASVLVLSGTFDQLTDMLIFAVYIFYGATAMGVFILRRRMPDAHRPYKVWGYPVVPAIFVLFCVGSVLQHNHHPSARGSHRPGAYPAGYTGLFSPAEKILKKQGLSNRSGVLLHFAPQPFSLLP